MKIRPASILERFRQSHFEIKHIVILFLILIAMQLLISLVQKLSLEDFLRETQVSYQRDSAERLANLTATALELLLETAPSTAERGQIERRRTIEALNIMLSQQLLVKNVEEICVLVASGDSVSAIDNGDVLLGYFSRGVSTLPEPDNEHSPAVALFRNARRTLEMSEQLQSSVEGEDTFHVLVPLVLKGEYAGALYMKNAPDFSFLTSGIIASYNQSSLIFVLLVLLGFGVMFLISSNTLRERDAAQELLFRERELKIEERIRHQKEIDFARRIYHTHHKAEKVTGFIKEDLRELSTDNIDTIKSRVYRYANFVSRVIYNMKWDTPPIHTVRNPDFMTDLNDVIRFIVEHICLRVANGSDSFRFRLELDKDMRPVQINEYVVWEVLEPLLQNSMDHNAEGEINIQIRTIDRAADGSSRVEISDDGKGLAPDLVELDASGRKRIFCENVSTKAAIGGAGFGCYIAYEIATGRCGWSLDAENLDPKGCKFSFSIPR